MEAQDVSDQGSNKQTQKSRKPRKRMKAIYAKIRDQMEFYFGDANLHKDRFMKKIIEENSEGYVDLDIFLKFNKIASLTDNVDTIADALMYKSDMLEVNQDKTKVRRTTPILEPKNVDERTVYVECIPNNANHEWIKKLFSACGKVSYVSLPRYPSSRDLKGFAFVEFETVEGALSACQELNNPPVDTAIEKVGMFPKTSHQLDALKKKIPEDQIKDTEEKVKEMSSHGNHDEEIKHADETKNEDAEQDKVSDVCASGKRPRTVSENSSECPTPTKRKKSENQSDNNQTSDTDKTTSGGKKKSRKRKSRSKTCDTNTQDGEFVKSDNEMEKSVPEAVPEKRQKLDDDDVKHTESKDSKNPESKDGKNTETKDGKNPESKDGKNTETKDGKKTESKDGKNTESKDSKNTETKDGKNTETKDGKNQSNDKENDLKKKRKRMRNKKEKEKKHKEIPELRVITKKEWLKLRKEYLDLQKTNMKMLKETLNEKKIEALKEEENKKKKKEIQFIPNVIVKVTSKEPITRKKLKESLKEDIQVAYVDLHDGLCEGHIRCQNSDSATQLLDVSVDGISFSLLSDEAEKVYWDKLTSDRETKLNSKCRSKKRGHQKLMDKAQKASLDMVERKHIVFDDE